MAITTNGAAGSVLSVSNDLALAISDESGTGVVVFNTSPTLVTPTLGTASATAIELGHASDTTLARASAGVVTIEGVNVVTRTSTDTLTNKTLTLPVIDNPVFGYTTTVTAAGSTTLTASSNYQQLFTGSTTQTVVLPVASTMTLGQSFYLENNSTGAVTVNSSGGNLVATLVAGTTALIMSILTSGTTAASWDVDFTGFATIVGTGSAVLVSGSGTSGQVLSSTGSGTQWTTLSAGTTANDQAFAFAVQVFA
jgi:hypothetical protein